MEFQNRSATDWQNTRTDADGSKKSAQYILGAIPIEHQHLVVAQQAGQIGAMPDMRKGAGMDQLVNKSLILMYPSQLTFIFIEGT